MLSGSLLHLQRPAVPPYIHREFPWTLRSVNDLHFASKTLNLTWVSPSLCHTLNGCRLHSVWLCILQMACLKGDVFIMTLHTFSSQRGCLIGPFPALWDSSCRRYCGLEFCVVPAIGDPIFCEVYLSATTGSTQRAAVTQMATSTHSQHADLILQSGQWVDCGMQVWFCPIPCWDVIASIDLWSVEHMAGLHCYHVHVKYTIGSQLSRLKVSIS